MKKIQTSINNFIWHWFLIRNGLNSTVCSEREVFIFIFAPSTSLFYEIHFDISIVGSIQAWYARFFSFYLSFSTFFSHFYFIYTLPIQSTMIWWVVDLQNWLSLSLLLIRNCMHFIPKKVTSYITFRFILSLLFVMCCSNFKVLKRRWRRWWWWSWEQRQYLHNNRRNSCCHSPPKSSHSLIHVVCTFLIAISHCVASILLCFGIFISNVKLRLVHNPNNILENLCKNNHKKILSERERLRELQIKKILYIVPWQCNTRCSKMCNKHIFFGPISI